MSLNSFLPAGIADGTSLAAGAFAVLGTGSVALTRLHAFGGASFRHPVTLTISTFAGAGAACAAISATTSARVVMHRMIPLVADATTGTRRPQSTQRKPASRESLRTLRPLRSMVLAAAMLCLAAALEAHDLEHTQVVVTFARDGSFI